MRRKEDSLTKLEFEVMTILWDLDRPACAKPVARTQTGLYYCGYISEGIVRKRVSGLLQKQGRRQDTYVCGIGVTSRIHTPYHAGCEEEFLWWQPQVDVQLFCPRGETLSRRNTGIAFCHLGRVGEWVICNIIYIIRCIS